MCMLLSSTTTFNSDVSNTGRAGIPMEVMGLMLGQFVDDYTITCIDVFAMPQVSAVAIYIIYSML